MILSLLNIYSMKFAPQAGFPSIVDVGQKITSGVLESRGTSQFVKISDIIKTANQNAISNAFFESTGPETSETGIDAYHDDLFYASPHNFVDIGPINTKPQSRSKRQLII